ncbi:hypothetical protein BG005_004157, partial [Podila minutissima]
MTICGTALQPFQFNCMWQEAVRLIDKWGSAAVSKANNKAKKLFEDNLHKNKTTTTWPIQYQWSCPTPTFVWASLALVTNINLLHPLPDANDPIKDVLGAPTSALRSAGDFYHGLTPVMLTTTWKSLFKVPLSVAQAVAHKFVKFLEQAAMDKIWLPH